MSNCFPVGDVNIDLFETSVIGNKYLNSLKMDGCYQGIKHPSRVTPTSKSLLDHIVHNDCLAILNLVSSKPVLQIIMQLMSIWI